MTAAIPRNERPATKRLPGRDPAESVSGLRRTLGFGSLTFFGVGLILGAGIYSILGEAAGVAGPALWLSFLLGSIAALLTGLSYAELATMYPKAGAEYVYLGKAWPRASWLRGMIGWTMAAAGIATAATVSLAFAGYAGLFVPAPRILLALGLLLAVGLLNVLGVREAGWANVAFTLVEAAGLVALIVVGARMPGFGDAFLSAPHLGVLAGAGLIFFAFLGFEDIANLAEETIEPSKNVPRAILTAVGVSTILYVLVAAASVALLDPSRLAQSASPLADAMRAGAPGLAGALGGIALFATANTALIAITAVSRLLFGMAREGDAPPWFARTLAKRKTPALGILFACVAAAAFLPLGGVGAVGSVASLMALVAFASVNAALIRLRFREADVRRPFRIPLSIGRWPVLPTLGFVVCALLAGQFGRLTYALGAGALIVGLLLERVAWGNMPRRGRGRPG